MTLLPELRAEVLDAGRRHARLTASKPASRTAASQRPRIRPLALAAIVVTVASAGAATAAGIVSPRNLGLGPTGKVQTPPNETAATLEQHFVALRGPATGVPASVGMPPSPGSGMNPRLAREFTTSLGAVYLIPAAHGGLCIWAPGPVKKTAGFTCVPSAKALRTGIELGFAFETGRTIRTLAVPDGTRVIVEGPAGQQRNVPLDDGVATVTTAKGEHLKLLR